MAVKESPVTALQPEEEPPRSASPMQADRQRQLVARRNPSNMPGQIRRGGQRRMRPKELPRPPRGPTSGRSAPSPYKSQPRARSSSRERSPSAGSAVSRASSADVGARQHRELLSDDRYSISGSDIEDGHFRGKSDSPSRRIRDGSPSRRARDEKRRVAAQRSVQDQSKVGPSMVTENMLDEAEYAQKALLQHKSGKDVYNAYEHIFQMIGAEAHQQKRRKEHSSRRPPLQRKAPPRGASAAQRVRSQPEKRGLGSDRESSREAPAGRPPSSPRGRGSAQGSRPGSPRLPAAGFNPYRSPSPGKKNAQNLPAVKFSHATHHMLPPPPKERRSSLDSAYPGGLYVPRSASKISSGKHPLQRLGSSVVNSAPTLPPRY
eukprot:gnl/TRDRNA2_/TRDRNA2_137245_c3_seq1.p1 gnl/TRDRNA2_/TRDRNA2_137245_c3~~gnl/TRDRNA2_/TRDRNA2_137245_c3_seq1.p1  ORF type:complete len:385 (+),score=49.31 gnl/TRDRNA2_/TRDRNA2_137245_c3_seq1:30-1157(+)